MSEDSRIASDIRKHNIIQCKDCKEKFQNIDGLIEHLYERIRWLDSRYNYYLFKDMDKEGY